MKFIDICTVLLILAVLSSYGMCFALEQSDDDVLFSAMQDEMNRSLEELQIDDEPKPYFLSYAVSDVSKYTVHSILGESGDTNSSRQRYLSVNLRVGDHETDNTNFLDSPGGSTSDSLPITDSYEELRRVLWMATDKAYKSAIRALAAKKMVLEQQVGLDRSADFSKENKTFQYFDPQMTIEIDRNALKELTKQISVLLAGYPELQTAITHGDVIHNWRSFLDSDGNKNRVLYKQCIVHTQVSTQAINGNILSDFASFFATECSEIAEDMVTISTVHEQLVERLLALRDAETLDSYVGPVLLEDQAAAELIVHTLATKLVASPDPISADGNVFAALGGMMSNSFVNKIGARVLPSFMYITNDPTIGEFKGTRLAGAYVVDLDGIPAQRTELVSEGRLVNLLTTRSPVKEFTKSTGSNRYVGAPMAGNLFISASKSNTREELMEEMLNLAYDEGLEFGIVIKKLSNFAEDFSSEAILNSLMQSIISGNTFIMPSITAYKVYEDGTEVPIQPVSISEFVDRNLRDIVAVSRSYGVFNIPGVGFTGGMFAGAMQAGVDDVGSVFDAVATVPFIGVVTPSLLIEELTLRNAATDKQQLPLYDHPMSSD